MKIVDTLITKFVEKILKEMDQMSNELLQEKDLKPIDNATQSMNNDKIYKKLFARQSLLAILKIF